MTVQLPNRDALAKMADGDQRTIRFLEDLTAQTNASANALSAAGFGGVGSLAFVRHRTAATAMVAGLPYAGADLAYAGFRSDGAAFSADLTGTVLSGTWLALGTANPTGGNFAFTLSVRVA